MGIEMYLDTHAHDGLRLQMSGESDRVSLARFYEKHSLKAWGMMPGRYLTLELGGAIVGAVRVGLNTLGELVVDSKHRGKGYGRLLWVCGTFLVANNNSDGSCPGPDEITSEFSDLLLFHRLYEPAGFRLYRKYRRVDPVL